MTEPTPVQVLVARGIRALEHLEARGLEVEDEWQYVTDLVAAWRSRMTAVATERPGEMASPAAVAAVEAAAEEAELVEDPHRAIDWLSTLPQIVLAALGATA